MKKKITTLTLLVLFAFGITNAITAQTTHQITLRVNTAKITKETVNQNSNFGQAQGISNENYTIEVNLGDTVRWNGISTSSQNDRVEIVSINYHGGARLFANNVLNGSNGIVTGVVTQGKKGDSEKYIVKFRIYRNGIRINTLFQIDPKIVIKQ